MTAKLLKILSDVVIETMKNDVVVDPIDVILYSDLKWVILAVLAVVIATIVILIVKKKKKDHKS